MAKPSGLYVNRWTKHGHDRLYVETEAGRKVGWYDLQNRKLYVDNPDERRIFGKALKEWEAGTALQRRPGGRRQWTDPDVDLADQKAGAGLLQVADRVRPQNRGIRVLAKLLGVRTADQAYRAGAKGERKVGRKLARLERRGFRVLHNVMLPGGGDVDHLVIGPAGVWTINTKHHRGATVKIGSKTVFVRNRPCGYPASAHRESQRAAEVLRGALGRPVNVAPMVVIHGAVRVRGWLFRRPLGVAVIPSWAVRWWFGGRAALSPAEVETLYDVARRGATWQRA